MESSRGIFNTRLESSTAYLLSQLISKVAAYQYIYFVVWLKHRFSIDSDSSSSIQNVFGQQSLQNSRVTHTYQWNICIQRTIHKTLWYEYLLLLSWSIVNFGVSAFPSWAKDTSHPKRTLVWSMWKNCWFFIIVKTKNQYYINLLIF